MNTEDTRSKNKYFDLSSAQNYLAEYADTLKQVLASIEATQLNQAIHCLESTLAAGAHIYAAGNGGSASIADHLCCDWTKGICTTSDSKPIRIFSLASNTALFTACANDLSYAQAFEEQLKFFLQKGDLVVLISSSGNSENIVRAADEAKRIGATVMGLTGFSGGKLREKADISLHIPFHNYGIVEDAHQALMHAMAQIVYLKKGNLNR